MQPFKTLVWMPRSQRRATVNGITNAEYAVRQTRCPDEGHLFPVKVTYQVFAPDPQVAAELVARDTASHLMPGWHSHREPGDVVEVRKGWDGNGYYAPVLVPCESY